MSAQAVPRSDDPADFVDRLLELHDEAFVVDVAEELERRRVGNDLARVMRLWQLSHTDLGALFGVSRQAASRWVRRGVPADRVGQVTDVVRITDLLQHHLKNERIPAVVRRAAPALDGESLLGLVAAGRVADALALTRAMFTFGETHG